MTTQLRLVPTNLTGHFTFERPPEKFDFLRASADELHSFGLPHRPDPKLLPRAARRWQRIMSRIRGFATPKLTVRNDIQFGPPRKIVMPDPGLEFSPITTPNWSGVVLNDAPPYQQVWGTWMIPAVQLPPGQEGSFFCAEWGGIGGFFVDRNLLQAGTLQETSVLTGTSYSAWVEWFPAPQVTIASDSGFPGTLSVGPGEVLAVLVGATPDGRGLINMVNLHTGIAITPIVVPIPTVDQNGNPTNFTGPSGSSAEWIMERPGQGTTVLQLGDFGEFNFTDAGAVAAGPGSGGDVVKTETIAAADDSQAFSVAMKADDDVTIIATETNVEALHITFDQTAAGQ
jgi:hypothetical protein